MTRNRILFIDLAKGIAILLVVIGHIDTTPYIKPLIYSFHMPLFFILSGYFFKKNESILETSKKLFNTLIIPYLIIGTIMRGNTLVVNAVNGLPINKFDLLSLPLVLWRWNGNFVSAGAIWFLPVLFLSKLYLTFITKYSKYLLILVSGAILSILFVKKIDVIPPFGLLQSLVCSGFIFAGSLFNKYNIFKYKIGWLLIIVLWGGVIFSLEKNILGVQINYYPNGIFTLIETCFISYLFCVSCQRLEELILFNRINKYFIWCGRYSLIILCVHSIEARFEWFSLPHEYFIAEIIIRIAYISVLAWLCTLWKPTRWLFHIQSA